LDVLDVLLGRLPADLPASLFIVHHMAPEGTGEALLNRLGRHVSFRCKMAEKGESFERGRVYIAPADSHLLVKETTVLVTKGARENRYRPAMGDPSGQRFRCHTGHFFTAVSFLVSQSERIEETLSIALRMFEERKKPRFISKGSRRCW